MTGNSFDIFSSSCTSRTSKLILVHSVWRPKLSFRGMSWKLSHYEEHQPRLCTFGDWVGGRHQVLNIDTRGEIELAHIYSDRVFSSLFNSLKSCQKYASHLTVKSPHQWQGLCTGRSLYSPCICITLSRHFVLLCGRKCLQHF